MNQNAIFIYVKESHERISFKHSVFFVKYLTYIIISISTMIMVLIIIILTYASLNLQFKYRYLFWALSTVTVQPQFIFFIIILTLFLKQPQLFGYFLFLRASKTLLVRGLY